MFATSRAKEAPVGSSFGMAYPKLEGTPIHPDELATWTFDKKFTQEQINEYLAKQEKAYYDYWSNK